jgi:hypothetical protein
MMELTTYAALITAFNDKLQVPAIESTLTVVYASNAEDAGRQAIFESIDSVLPISRGWSNHQAIVRPIQGLLALGKSDCYLHIYAIRIFKKTSEGVTNMKTSLYYQINRIPDSDVSTELRSQITTIYSPLDWEIVVDRMSKRVMYSDAGPLCLN